MNRSITSSGIKFRDRTLAEMLGGDGGETYDWRQDAACHDDPSFHTGIFERTTKNGIHYLTEQGKACIDTCASCPVLSDCTDWLAEDEYNRLTEGVIAGTLPSQRYGGQRELIAQLTIEDKRRGFSSRELFSDIEDYVT